MNLHLLSSRGGPHEGPCYNRGDRFLRAINRERRYDPRSLMVGWWLGAGTAAAVCALALWAVG
jgi:hypothetical protein